MPREFEVSWDKTESVSSLLQATCYPCGLLFDREEKFILFKVQNERLLRFHKECLEEFLNALDLFLRESEKVAEKYN